MKCFANQNLIFKRSFSSEKVTKIDCSNVKEVNEDEKYIVMDYLDQKFI